MPSTLPDLAQIVFFNTDKEQDWRIDSSPEVLAIVRHALNQGPSFHANSVPAARTRLTRQW
jgi:hypothetical protein